MSLWTLLTTKLQRRRGSVHAWQRLQLVRLRWRPGQTRPNHQGSNIDYLYRFIGSGVIVTLMRFYDINPPDLEVCAMCSRSIFGLQTRPPYSTRRLRLNSKTMHPEPPNSSSQIEQKHVLLSEILAVTSTMRKNSRWAAAAHTLVARDSALAKDLGLRRGSPSIGIQRPGRLSQEADLMGGFQELKRTIRDVEGKRYAAC